MATDWGGCNSVWRKRGKKNNKIIRTIVQHMSMSLIKRKDYSRYVNMYMFSLLHEGLLRIVTSNRAWGWLEMFMQPVIDISFVMFTKTFIYYTANADRHDVNNVPVHCGRQMKTSMAKTRQVAGIRPNGTCVHVALLTASVHPTWGTPGVNFFHGKTKPNLSM